MFLAEIVDIDVDKRYIDSKGNSIFNSAILLLICIVNTLHSGENFKISDIQSEKRKSTATTINEKIMLLYPQ